MSIDIENIRKRFGIAEVLSDINLKIASGEMIALLGPSGSGKTTLLRILAGLETETSGRIRFGKSDVTQLTAAERRVGFVFQNYALFRHMTVAENVAFGLTVKPRSERLPKAEIEKRVAELLAMVQLSDKAGHYPAQLSGGQQQRVALARVLAVEPEVLLLDEPFGALDAQVREELRQWIKRLHRELGFTGVFVTHDQEEAMQVADRVVVMHNGRIEQADKPAEIWEHPKTRFVIEFLSDVNRIPAMISNGRLHVGTVDLALDGGADGRPVVDPKSIPDGPADLLLRPKDARMRRLEAEEDSAAAQKAGLVPVVIRSAVPKGGAIQVEAEPEGWYENALNAFVLEDALPRLGRGYLMSFERAYLYRGEERLPVHVRKPRWPFVGEHGHEHSSPEAAEPPKALKHEAALFI